MVNMHVNKPFKCQDENLVCTVIASDPGHQHAQSRETTLIHSYLLAIKDSTSAKT